jgi:undecaprenyl-diphosphatase
MSLINSIIMGLVQGIAEFLPISSSGHLAIMQQLLHMKLDNGLFFDVLLHLGTLVAVFIVFWKDIKELIVEGFKIIGDFCINIGRLIKYGFTKKPVEFKQVISTPYRRFVILIIISTIPIVIVGFLFSDAIEKANETLLVPGLCLILTGVLLTIADRTKTGNKTEKNATFKDAGFVGLAQACAILPGLSRSGTTITACLLTGFEKSYAVKYSFIMSIPAVLGATVVEFKDVSLSAISQNDLLNYLVGTIVAGAVGYIAIKTMLVIVKGKKFIGFSIYCFIIGIVAVAGYFLA